MIIDINNPKDFETQRREKLQGLGVLQICPRCHGTKVVQGSTCRCCNGEGVLATSGYFS